MTTMIKQIKKWGSSLVLRFSPDEVRFNKLKEGVFIEIDIKEAKKDGNNESSKKRQVSL